MLRYAINMLPDLSCHSCKTIFDLLPNAEYDSHRQEIQFSSTNPTKIVLLRKIEIKDDGHARARHKIGDIVSGGIESEPKRVIDRGKGPWSVTNICMINDLHHLLPNP